MGFDKEIMQDISAIYRYIYRFNEKGEGVHRNTLKRYLLQDKKISSKAKYNAAIESLLALDKITMKRENVSLSPSISNVGLLQKREHYYIVVPNSNKRYPVDKRVAQGYKPGDILDVIIDSFGEAPEAIILGKSQKKIDYSAFKDKEKSAQPEKPVTIHGNRLLGRVVKTSHDKLVFIPNDKTIPLRHIPILNDKEESVNYQDKICIMDMVDTNLPLLGGTIVEVKGNAGNPIQEYDAIAQYHNASDWSTPELQDEIAKIPTSVDTQNLKLITEEQSSLGQGGIVDLRHLHFATIDPADCKDMDDAIYSTIDENGDYVCYTAVANVTKYVDLNSSIGQQYLEGAFTIYVPNKAYSILPSALSTGICSLNPDEDRLALVIKSVVDKDTGKTKSSQIYDSIIRSRHKYSYEQAQEICDTISQTTTFDTLRFKTASGDPLTSEEQLLMNYLASKTKQKLFDNRKMMKFNSNDEKNIIFNEDMSDILDISTREELEFHKVIEAFMITANEAAAEFTINNNIDSIYRIHDKPSEKKIQRSNEFFSLLGIKINDITSPDEINKLIEAVKGSESEEMINRFLIRMQSRAIYSNDLHPNEIKNDGKLYPGVHTGLGIEDGYSHTTSPIRRLVDYVVHYNILAKLHGTKQIPKETIDKIIEIANKRQLEIDEAEKEFETVNSVIYAEKHIGEKFTGSVNRFRIATISEGFQDEIMVTSKNDQTGICAEIPLTQIIGLKANDCRISKQGYAIYDEKGHVMLKVCDPIDFIIEKVDRKSMSITGKTNKTLLKESKDRIKNAKKFFKGQNGYIDKTKNHVKAVKMNTATNENQVSENELNENQMSFEDLSKNQNYLELE